MNAPRTLVVDDDPDIRALLRELLERAGHEVVDAPDGRQALRRFFETRPDLVILDVTMPEIDGWQTLDRIRELSDVPVMMLTARAAELERVRGLRGGADDYVTKPFGRQELIARVDALLRRASRTRSEDAPDLYSDPSVTIDFAHHAVTVGDREVALTPLEFRLLSAFVRHPGQVLSHDQLLELVWGDVGAASRDQVKLYVGYLRRKLEPEGDGLVETVRGFGYRYQPARLPAA